jgi:hypothetical protein
VLAASIIRGGKNSEDRHRHARRRDNLKSYELIIVQFFNKILASYETRARITVFSFDFIRRIILFGE